MNGVGVRKRIRRVKSAISSMSNYIENILQDEDEDFENFRSIIGKIESPKNEAVREKTIIPDDDVDKFLDKLVSEERYQQACAFALAAMSGARKSELLRFKVEYFDENNIVYGGLYKTPKIKTKELVKQVNSSINMCFMSLRNTLIYGWNNVRNKALRANGFLYIDVVMVLMHK